MNQKKTIEKNNYAFKKTDDDFPQNIFCCQFFKTGSEGELISQKSLSKVKAYCSIRNQVLEDYKICCTKHEGNNPSGYLHCQSYAEKLGNMSDKDRLELRNLYLIKESLKEAKNSTNIAKIMAIISAISAFIALLALILKPILKKLIY